MSRQTIFFDKNLGAHAYEEDGTLTVRQGKLTAEMSEAGIALNVSDIRRISISNITDLIRYHLVNGDKVVTHEFAFKDGGHGTIAYTLSGDVQNFSLHECKLSIRYEPDVEITISMKNGNW